MSTSHVCVVLIAGFLGGVAAWCQASSGSCVGELRNLEKPKELHGLNRASGLFEGAENISKDLFRFVDWDGDGDVDVLLGTYMQNSFRILFYERVSDDSFLVHKPLVTLNGLHRKRPISKDYFFHRPLSDSNLWGVRDAYLSKSSTVEGFQVADWDGDGRLDLLLCMQGPTASNITFLNRAALPVNSMANGSLILSTSSVRRDMLCDMQPVDFDKDGVVDLFLGGFTRYFRRQSTDSDLIEHMNPLGIYNGSVLQVFDFDADGQLELLLDAFPQDHDMKIVAFRWLRRALDGNFVESEENPFADVLLGNNAGSVDLLEDMYLTDWNSDGLPDVVVVSILEYGDKSSLLLQKWYQQVRNRDMIYNSHFTVFEEVRVQPRNDQVRVLDWNQDGVDDLVNIVDTLPYFNEDNNAFYEGHSALYAITDAKELPGAVQCFRCAYVDWDGDGDLDILLRRSDRLKYYEQVDGRMRYNRTFPEIRFSHQPGLFAQGRPEFFLTVDWDQDGDADLILLDGYKQPARYFEQLPNGSLHEKQQHPFKEVLRLVDAFLDGTNSAHFLDCDGDGDLDVLRVNVRSSRPIEACEHDKDAGTLTCGHEFLCLGTNLNNFRLGPGTDLERFGKLRSLDLVNVSDGRLNFVAIHDDKPNLVLWTAGFCTPRSPCHRKGFCEERQRHCTCKKGHELGDCSQCERHFHGDFPKIWQVRECKPCPESDGRLCHGRGECFDDASARDSTALLAAGNGSCRCHEVFFNGIDADGRSTCSEGSCPAGSEEKYGTCHQCDGGSFSVAGGSCTPCPAGSIVLNFSCTKCPAGFIAPKPGLFACEPCSAGSHSKEGSSICRPCPSDSVSHPASSSCTECNADFNFFRGVPDESNSKCQVDIVEILLLGLSAVAATSFCFLCLTGFHGRIAIADVSTQGQKLVMTANLSHFLLKQSPKVTFKGTENPNLDDSFWTVQKLNSFQLTLHGSQLNILNQVDTSMGHLMFQCPWAFIHTGLLRCPLILWCLLFGAGSAAAMTRLTLPSKLVAIAIGICAGSLAFALRCRLSGRTPISKRRRQFLKEWPLPRQPCERGPDRSMTAGQLQDFVQFFEAFIKERSMYYVCSHIVKPLTKPFQLSFVELIGPSSMEWFVSHYWGMAVRHFNDAIRKHALSYYADDWRESAYWICTFSNSQWHVTDELGNGAWQESSFYLALSSPSCRGTAMVIDEQVLPLQRIWCLFEVYHTILLSQNDDFEGLLLCTSMGVLQEGRAGTDVAVRVAQRVRELDTRTAQASNQEDLRMIHELIENMRGGFGAMNQFVRETICRALARSHEQYELTFQGLICDLASQGASVRAEAIPPAEGPLPTLLPRRNADFAFLPKGQESPGDIYPLP